MILEPAVLLIPELCCCMGWINFNTKTIYLPSYSFAYLFQQGMSYISLIIKIK